MEVTGLRVGNSILVRGVVTRVNIIIEYEGVNGYHDEGIGGMNYEDEGCGREDDCDPIPLTIERLKTFGFTYLKRKPGTQGVYSNGKMNVHLSNSGNIYRVNKLIPYIHKLQNLYYELYDEELEKTI